MRPKAQYRQEIRFQRAVLLGLYFARKTVRHTFMERWFDCPVDGSPVHCKFEAQGDEVNVTYCSNMRENAKCDRRCSLE